MKHKKPKSSLFDKFLSMRPLHLAVLMVGLALLALVCALIVVGPASPEGSGNAGGLVTSQSTLPYWLAVLSSFMGLLLAIMMLLAIGTSYLVLGLICQAGAKNWKARLLYGIAWLANVVFAFAAVINLPKPGLLALTVVVVTTVLLGIGLINAIVFPSDPKDRAEVAA